MTRWLRFLLTVVRSWFRPRLRVDGESRLAFRIWPTEADLSLANHAALLTLLEQGRIDFILRSGFLRFLQRRRWTSVLGSMTVQFRAPLRRLERCELRTRAAGWDETWIYLEHRLERRGKLVVAGLAKIAILEPGRRVLPTEALRAFGLTLAPPPLPGMIEPLVEGESRMHRRIEEWPPLDWSVEVPG